MAPAAGVMLVSEPWSDMNPHPALDWRVKLPLAACLLAALALAAWVFVPFALTFTLAGSAALLLNPLQKRLTRLCRGRRSPAAGVLVLLCVALLLVPVLSWGILLTRQADAFLTWVRPRLDPVALERLSHETLASRFPALAAWMGREGGEIDLASLVWAGLGRLAAGANGLVQGLLGQLAGALLDLVLFVMMLFFLLRDGPQLQEAVRAVSPLSREQEAEMLDHLTRTVRGIFQAVVVVPFFQAVAAYVGFLVFGVPSPLLWAVMVMMAAWVPLLGSPLGWVPAAVYLLVSGDTGRGMGMFLYGILVISTIDNVVKPLILKGAAQIHTLLAFLSILGGVFAFGPKGVVAGPVVLSLLMSSYRIYRYDVLRWRQEREAGEGTAGPA